MRTANMIAGVLTGVVLYAASAVVIGLTVPGIARELSLLALLVVNTVVGVFVYQTLQRPGRVYSYLAERGWVLDTLSGATRLVSFAAFFFLMVPPLAALSWWAVTRNSPEAQVR